MKKFTDEMFASIPALIEQGLGKAEIAMAFGVKPTSLQVLCCKRGISLRRDGRLLPRRRLALPKAALTLSNTTLLALRTTARAMGTDEVQLASDLLEHIVKDNLYKAVLDVERAK